MLCGKYSTPPTGACLSHLVSGQLPCLPLPLDACMLDASNCSDGVPAGSLRVPGAFRFVEAKVSTIQINTSNQIAPGSVHQPC